MPSRFDLVTLVTTDTDAASRFWSAALDLVELEREDGDRWIVVGELDGRRRIGFQRTTNDIPACAWHLDLECRVRELDAEVDRLVTLGATLLAPIRVEPYGVIANLADPQGNLFDLCAYRASEDRHEER